MAPKRLKKGQKKRSIDEDPFWDTWEEQEESPEPVARRRSPSKHRKKYKQLTGSVDDPFGYDGFGDSWEKPRARRIVHRNSSPVMLPEELIALEDAPDGSDSWCTSTAVRKKSWDAEEHLKAHNAKMARLDAEQKEKTELEAKKEAEKAAAEAAAEAAKAAAEAEWNQQVELAKGFIARADPVQALNTLHALSQNLEIIHHIDQEAKKEVSELYTTLYTHWELQQSLTQGFASRSSYDDNSPAGSDSKEESSRIESSTCNGGDTVKVNCSTADEEMSEIGTGSTAVVVDRLPTHLSKTKDGSRSSTIFEGDTVKVGEESCNETGSATVVVDRCKHDCCSEENSSDAFPNRASLSAPSEPRAALVEANDNQGSLPFKHNK